MNIEEEESSAMVSINLSGYFYIINIHGKVFHNKGTTDNLDIINDYDGKLYKNFL